MILGGLESSGFSTKRTSQKNIKNTVGKLTIFNLMDNLEHFDCQRYKTIIENNIFIFMKDNRFFKNRYDFYFYDLANNIYKVEALSKIFSNHF